MSIVNEAGVAIQPDAPARMLPHRVRSKSARQRYRNWRQRCRDEDLTAAELAKRLGRPARTVAAGIRWAILDEERRQSRPTAWHHPNLGPGSGGLTADDVVTLVEKYGPGTDLGSEAYFRQFLTPLVTLIVHRYPCLTALKGWLDGPVDSEPIALSAA